MNAELFLRFCFSHALCFALGCGDDATDAPDSGTAEDAGPMMEDAGSGEA